MLSAPTPQVSPERLMQFTFGFAPPLMIETAIRYGVFDILDNRAKSLDALCAETGTSSRGLRMVLDALVGLDLLSKDDTGHYALTEESATFLVTGKPTYHGAFFLLTKEPMLSSWSQLDEVVKSGRSVHHINREQEGSSFFLRFVEDIFPIHYPGAQALARALGVQSEPASISVLDLAAGSGVWSIAIAQQSPQIPPATGFTLAMKNVPERRDRISLTEIRGMQIPGHKRVSVCETVASGDFLCNWDNFGPINSGYSGEWVKVRNLMNKQFRAASTLRSASGASPRTRSHRVQNFGRMTSGAFRN